MKKKLICKRPPRNLIWYIRRTEKKLRNFNFFFDNKFQKKAQSVMFESSKYKIGLMDKKFLSHTFIFIFIFVFFCSSLAEHKKSSSMPVLLTLHNTQRSPFIIFFFRQRTFFVFVFFLFFLRQPSVNNKSCFVRLLSKYWSIGKGGKSDNTFNLI